MCSSFNEKNKLLYDNNDMLHGEQLIYKSDDKLRHKYQYHNGEKHGEQISYSNNNLIKYIDNYYKGKKHGECISYFSGVYGFSLFYINGECVTSDKWLVYNIKIKRLNKLKIINIIK